MGLTHDYMTSLNPNSPEENGVHAALGRTATTECAHAVHFYEDDALFLDSLSHFIGGALGAGGACVVVVGQPHRDGLAHRLAALGIDLTLTAAQDRYIALDAGETLARFMVDGLPDEQRFFSTVEPAFDRARAAFIRHGQPVAPGSEAASVVAFGEMVAQLFRSGNIEGAVHLEQLWNELARRQAFSLRCAYPMHLFATEEQAEQFRRICAEHTHVIPAESYTSLENDSDRWRMISSLQRKASNLHSALELRRRETDSRLRVEEKLRRAEEFSRAILESTADCVMVLSIDGLLRYINTPGCRAMEIADPSSVLDRDWVEIWSVEDRPRIRAALEEAASGKIGSFQADCPTFHGDPRSWDVRITAYPDAAGNIDSLIAVSRDVTALRQAQTAAIHAEKLSTAGRMAATIAHEINNPLEAVTNFIYLAQIDKRIPEDVRHQLEAADRELTRIAHIARQTLGFYRSTSTNRWLTVADLIGDALMVYERRLRNKELNVEISVPRDLQVYGRDGEVRQVLLNLTANAIDACAQGGRIWIRAQRSRKWTNGLGEGVRFTIADNGSGMSPETQRRVFAPFFTTKADVGTGIGLWVTKCLVEQRGGAIRFRSRQGAGTVMSFFLPSPRPAATLSAA
ncbi:MAG TPA: ATP-binding protein [Terracidiphilus sp.]|jgi:PAS domain S-box-containing protein|nr:ATP-binding protein [Terracidiphilus sp.]